MSEQSLTNKAEPYLVIMHQGVMKLHPVSCSNMDPPIQICWLYNGGNTAVSFKVDLDPFEELRLQNFGHKVIQVVTTHGSVAPRSFFGLKLRFSPIEYTEYMVALRIFPEYTDIPLEVIVKGSSVFTTSVCLRPDAMINDIRPYTMEDEDVPVRLTPSMITFPHFIPTGHSATTVVFLTNSLKESEIRFKWPKTPIEGGGSIRFQPDIGVIPPNEEISVRVTVEAGRASTTFVQMVRCSFEDDSLNAEYNYKYELWKREHDKDRLMDLWRDKNLVRGVEAFDDFVIETLDGRYNQERERRRRKGGIVKARPEPPEPPSGYSRHLAVSAYIGSVFGLYDVIGTREKSRMYSPLCISKSIPIPPDPEMHAGFVLSKFERTLSEMLISNILTDIFDCTSFHGFLREATKRLAPTYEEYRACEVERELEMDGQIDQSPPLLPHALEELIESVVFNLVQEMGTNYMHPEKKSEWLQLPPVQPKAIVRSEQLKNVLQEQHWDFFHNENP